VLTLRHFAPAKRQRIAQVLVQGKDSLEDISSSIARGDENVVAARGDDASDTSPLLPTKDQIPSHSDMAALENDLEKLQERLENTRAKRNDLLVQQHSLQKAETLLQKIETTLEKHDEMTANSQQAVTKVVTDGNSVQHLTQEAQSILDKLEHAKEKRTRTDEENVDDDDDPFFSTPTVSKQPRLSLEETYRRDCKALGLRDATNFAASSINISSQDDNNDDESNNNAAESAAPLSKLHALKQRLKSLPTAADYGAAAAATSTNY
ncbi:MAG: hypothetical protein SGARI_006538, partial [Bacillariaceae sp.]